jgi:hypothetical protein
MDRDRRIEARAYEIWEREGRPDGRHEAHWTQATGEIDAAAEAEVPARGRRRIRLADPVPVAEADGTARRGRRRAAAAIAAEDAAPDAGGLLPAAGALSGAGQS